MGGSGCSYEVETMSNVPAGRLSVTRENLMQGLLTSQWTSSPWSVCDSGSLSPTFLKGPSHNVFFVLKCIMVGGGTVHIWQISGGTIQCSSLGHYSSVAIRKRHKPPQSTHFQYVVPECGAPGGIIYEESSPFLGLQYINVGRCSLKDDQDLPPQASQQG